MLDSTPNAALLASVPMTGKRRTRRLKMARVAGLAAGLMADRLLGDPPTSLHPVAWFGTWVSTLEKRLYADDRRAGVTLVAASTLPLVGVSALIEQRTSHSALARFLTTAVGAWAVVGARSLRLEGQTMADRLDEDDLEGARAQLMNLCGRNAAELDEPELARATVESMAENTSDAVVGSLVWGGLLGLPGLVAHRCINTLDAMIGHHNDRYENFGWAAANLDDLVNWVPARLTGALACALAPTVDGDPVRAWNIMLRDGDQHPSPNGGWCESAFSGALGVQLGGRNIYYNGRVEERPLLGDGERPSAEKVRQAAQLVEYVSFAAAGVIGLISLSRLGRKR